MYTSQRSVAPKKLERKNLETMAVIVLVITFMLISCWNLGATQIPTTSFKVKSGESFYLDFKEPFRVKFLYLLYKGELNFKLLVGRPADWRKVNSIKISDYYRWINLWIGEKTRFIKFSFSTSNGEIVEIVAIDENDRPIKIHSIIDEKSELKELWKMIDEQDKVSLPPSYLTETYFDEVYYVRAAEDYLRGEDPYEWTHPPLGKLIITAGISILGYSPFSWRIIGVLFGALLIPLIYFLGKSIFGTFLGGFIPAFLVSFDFMHYTMARIATVDTYLVFFLTASHYFFFKHIKNVRKSRSKFFTSSLLLSIIFFALGFSTKWTALFGFFGQLVLFALINLRDNDRTAEEMLGKVKMFSRYLPYMLVWSLLVIPLYFLTFVPYMAIGHNLEDVLQRQWMMFNYHSMLKTVHPFSSEWWSWPFILKPVWFYCSGVRGETRSTITCMGNPAIWYFGFISILFVTFTALKKKRLNPLFISVIFFSQWLPYALLSRPLFLYHFYPNLPFLCLAATFVLRRLSAKNLGKALISSYMVLVVLLFGLYFPVISGYPVSEEWINLLRVLNSWVF